jgi:hypothetical protein
MARPIQDTLNSTIRDAVVFLSTSGKIDVLLCTMEHLPMNDMYVSQSRIGKMSLNTSLSQGPER